MSSKSGMFWLPTLIYSLQIDLEFLKMGQRHKAFMSVPWDPTLIDALLVIGYQAIDSYNWGYFNIYYGVFV